MADEDTAVDEGTTDVEVVLPEGLSFQEDEPTPPNSAAAPAKTEVPAKPTPPEAPGKPVPKTSPNVYQRFLSKSARPAPSAKPEAEPSIKPKTPAAEPAAPVFGARLDRFRSRVVEFRREAERVLPELAPVFEEFGKEIAALIDDHAGQVDRKRRETEAILGEIVERYGDVHAAVTAQRRFNRDKLIRQEARAKAQHKDWQEVIQRAGVFEAINEISPGKFADPELAFEIYSQDDPTEYAYRFAKDKLKHEGQEAGEEEVPAPATPEVQRAEVGAPKPTTPTPEEAERRGRAEVAAALTEHEGKPKGIRHLRSAGPGRALMDRAYLDKLMDEDYPRYLALINANGGKGGRLYRFHHGGF